MSWSLGLPVQASSHTATPPNPSLAETSGKTGSSRLKHGPVGGQVPLTVASTVLS